MNNATTAINTVVHSIPLEKGDVIYCLSVTYGKRMRIDINIVGYVGTHHFLRKGKHCLQSKIHLP